jgi:putative transposase
MQCTLKLKLLVSQEDHDALLVTMKQFNKACNILSQRAFAFKVFSKIKLQRLFYYEVREEFKLSAQMAIRALGKVCESYRIDKESMHTFRETGALVYDQRILSFKDPQAISLLTLKGRILAQLTISDYHRALLKGNRIHGQADLILQNNTFYLLLVVDIPEQKQMVPKNFIGIDLGIVNIAVDSTDETFSGAKVNGLRKRHAHLRSKLQKKNTKSSKRLLKKRSKKEKLFARDVNHCIAKKLVEKAKALQCGIALENLKGIRKRTEKTVGKAQRRQHASWSFYQLRQFIQYKATLAGIPVVLVDPKNTSRTCIQCGYIAKENRISRDIFCCRACEYVALADNLAAENIRRAAVNRLDVVA